MTFSNLFLKTTLVDTPTLFLERSSSLVKRVAPQGRVFSKKTKFSLDNIQNKIYTIVCMKGRRVSMRIELKESNGKYKCEEYDFGEDVGREII